MARDEIGESSWAHEEGETKKWFWLYLVAVSANVDRHSVLCDGLEDARNAEFHAFAIGALTYESLTNDGVGRAAPDEDCLRLALINDDIEDRVVLNGDEIKHRARDGFDRVATSRGAIRGDDRHTIRVIAESSDEGRRRVSSNVRVDDVIEHDFP